MATTPCDGTDLGWWWKWGNMTRIMSAWMARVDSPSVTVRTFALSRPTTTTTRPTSRWRRCPTTSPKERAHAHAQQPRRWSPSPRQRRHLLHLQQPQKRPQCPRQRCRRSTPLRRHQMPYHQPYQMPYQMPYHQRRTQPQQRSPLPQTQLQPQPHAETPRENAGPRPAYLNNARWPIGKATTNWPTTLLIAWSACSDSSEPRASPLPHCFLVHAPRVSPPPIRSLPPFRASLFYL